MSERVSFHRVRLDDKHVREKGYEVRCGGVRIGNAYKRWTSWYAELDGSDQVLGPFKQMRDAGYALRDRYDEEGDVVVLRPETFVARDGSVLPRKDQNYVPQPPSEETGT